jgi:hypothetical protein
MIYDLGQPIFNNVPQRPKFHFTSMVVPLLTATGQLMANFVSEAVLDRRFRRFAALAVLIERHSAGQGAVAGNEGEMS